MTKRRISLRDVGRIGLSYLVGVSLLMPFLQAPNAAAASLTAMSDTMSRLQVNTNSSHIIKFTTPTGVAVNNKTVILTEVEGGNANASYQNTSLVRGDLTLTWGPTTGAENSTTLAASPSSGSTWGAVMTNGTNGTNDIITLTSPNSGGTAITAGSIVILTIASTNSTNPVTAGTYIDDIGGNFGDTGRIAVSIVSNDQIPVSATVDPTITFVVPSATLGLSTLSTGSVSSAATTAGGVTVATNAPSGYSISVRDQGSGSNPGLYRSVAPATLIASNTATLSANTEGYGGQCLAVAGSGTCDYALTSGGNAVTAFSRTATAFAHNNAKPTVTETYTLQVKAAISGTTTAGAYADTLTLIGTGNF